MAYIVAIDGTAGSGKGSTTKIVAERLKMINIDTGIIYRCMTLDIINKNINIDETDRLEKVLEDIDIMIGYDGNTPIAILDGVDVTNKIRTNDVNNIVSKVSGLKIVRDKATKITRDIADKFLDDNISVIMEGRDIGTVVFPNALVKIYMDATMEERAMRRVKQNIENGIESTYEEVLENIRVRDYDDMHHKFGALKKAQDAIYLDTTTLTLDEVVERVIKIIKEKTGKDEV